jgi:hypothetical protein
MPDLLDLGKARKELEEKDLLTIERETAKTWGGRAAVSYAFVQEEGDHTEQMRCFWEAETYRAEAVEHAAMTEDAGFLAAILKEIEGHRGKARRTLVEAGHAFVQGSRTPKATSNRSEPPSRPLEFQSWDRLANRTASASRPSPRTPGMGRRPASSKARR